jgi:hypothetical protein
MSAVSLVFCILICVLWIRSRWIADEVIWRNHASDWGHAQWRGIGIIEGEFLIVRAPFYDAANDCPPIPKLDDFPLQYFDEKVSGKPKLFQAAPMLSPIYWIHGGIRWLDFSRWTRSPWWALFIPLWMPASVASLLPGCWLARRLRRRQLELTSHCRVCGYDLRATSYQCPECGTVKTNALTRQP